MAFPSIFSLSSSEEPDWAWLPQNVLFLIISQLFLLSDIVSFGSVCSRWRSVLKHRLQDLNIQPNMLFSRKLPMLLIPTDDNSESTRDLYSLSSAEVYDLKLPVPYNNRCIGSSHGWLIFLESFTFAITLFNPFYFGNSKGFVRIPPFLPAGDTCEMMKALERDFFSDYFICKAILSADPASCNDYIMMVIHGETRSLAYYKSENATWTFMYHNQPVFFDIIVHQGYFLAVNFWGEVYVCDVKSNVQPRIRLVTEPVVGLLGETMRRYIVELNDGITLLQAVRLVECSMSSGGELFLDTTGFMVYKLQALDDLLEWTLVKNINDGALFLGDNYSTYFKASDFQGIIPNSIYFTDDYHDSYTMFHKPYQFMGHRDSGIYLIENASFLNHRVSSPKQKHLPPPIWILPTI